MSCHLDLSSYQLRGKEAQIQADFEPGLHSVCHKIVLGRLCKAEEKLVHQLRFQMPPTCNKNSLMAAGECVVAQLNHPHPGNWIVSLKVGNIFPRPDLKMRICRETHHKSPCGFS